MTRLKHLLLLLITISAVSILWTIFSVIMDTTNHTRLIKGAQIIDNNTLPNIVGEHKNGQMNGTKVSNLQVEIDTNVIAKRFEDRREHVKESCKRIKGHLRKTRRLSYLKSNKIAYCFIEKIASTFWRRILYSVSHPSQTHDPFAMSLRNAYDNSAYTRIKDIGDVDYILKDSVSFLFVRNPFSKLLSGYFSKLFSLKSEFWGIGKAIIKAERHNASRKSLRCGDDVTFREFVSYHSKRLIAGKSIDSHFSPSINLCNVCMMDFKYIGKYETLEEDTKYIVSKFNVIDKIDIGTNFTERSMITLIKDQVNYMFARKSRWISCISIQCALYRVWKRFICRRVISKNIPFPYENQEKANRVTKEELIAITIEAHKKSSMEEIANNRNEVLAEAYRSLDNKTFHQMIRAFKDDFEIFNYSTKPDFIIHGEKISKSPHQGKEFSYLQDCPY